MICPNCGKETPDGMSFCFNCGAKLAAPSQAPQPAPQPAPSPVPASMPYYRSEPQPVTEPAPAPEAEPVAQPEPDPAPRPQFGQNGPQYGQNGPQFSPNGPQFGPNGPQYGPNGPQFGHNGPQYGPNGPQYGPNGPQYGPNGPQYNPPKQPKGPSAFDKLLSGDPAWVLNFYTKNYNFFLAICSLISIAFTGSFFAAHNMTGFTLGGLFLGGATLCAAVAAQIFLANKKFPGWILTFVAGGLRLITVLVTMIGLFRIEKLSGLTMNTFNWIYSLFALMVQGALVAFAVLAFLKNKDKYN